MIGCYSPARGLLISAASQLPPHPTSTHRRVLSFLLPVSPPAFTRALALALALASFARTSYFVSALVETPFRPPAARRRPNPPQPHPQSATLDTLPPLSISQSTTHTRTRASNTPASGCCASRPAVSNPLHKPHLESGTVSFRGRDI